MARPKSKGAYVPLAAQYFMDDAILEAGPDAELFFVRCLSFLASVSSDGFITDRQARTIVGIGLRNVTKRITTLQEVGLLEAVQGGFLVRSWTKWNKSAEEIGKLLAKDRERKARKDAEDAANSARNPDVDGTDSSPQSSTEQSSTERSSNVRAATRGTRLPADWNPTEADVAYAAVNAPSVDVVREAENFRDWWVAQPGQKGVKLDWPATWRRWVRRSHERNVERGWRPPDEGYTPGNEWMRR